MTTPPGNRKTPSRPLPPAPCRRCGYEMEGLTIDSGGLESDVVQWRAVCPECGHDNFGPPRRGRSWASLSIAVRAMLMASMLGVMLVAAAMLLHFW